MTRNLVLIPESATKFGQYAVFNRGGRRTKRLITHKEYEYAEKLIQEGNEYAIDNFCYSIS